MCSQFKKGYLIQRFGGGGGWSERDPLSDEIRRGEAYQVIISKEENDI